MIREQSIKEQDKLITVLPRSDGLIRAFIHGAKSIKSPKSTASGLLTYSRFSIYKGRDSYIIDECYAQEVFMPLRKDVEKLALAQYFCELAGELAPEGENAEEQLRLTLNSLHFLCQGSKPLSLIKSTFELRMLTLAGYMPNLVCCDSCGCYEHEDMRFLPQKGLIVCGDCCGKYSGAQIRIGLGVTRAMRHCVYSEFSKLFAYSLKEEAQPRLEAVSEEYLKMQISKTFQTLEFYKMLKN